MNGIPMPISWSGVILAGGLGTRFDGRDKARLRIGGRTVLERILDVFEGLFDDIVLVTNDPCRYLEHDLLIVSDLFPQRSSLTGVHAGLFYARHPHAFITACDTPFLRAGLVRLLLDATRPGDDIVVPTTAKGLEPLCAVYSRRCLGPVEDHLRRGNLKIRAIFERVRVRTVPAEQLRVPDPELRSFFNINSPADLAAALELEAAGRGIGKGA
jgi:molybdopterin-guanine dinucleotide biosynthesis protein A